MVTTRFGAAELLPPGATIQLEPGDLEVTQLRSIIERQRNERCLNHVGHAYALETFLTRTIAAELDALLTRVAAPLQDALKRWEAIEADARTTLLNTVIAGRQRKLGATRQSLADDPMQNALAELGWFR